MFYKRKSLLLKINTYSLDLKDWRRQSYVQKDSYRNYNRLYNIVPAPVDYLTLIIQDFNTLKIIISLLRDRLKVIISRLRDRWRVEVSHQLFEFTRLTILWRNISRHVFIPLQLIRNMKYWTLIFIFNWVLDI